MSDYSLGFNQPWYLLLLLLVPLLWWVSFHSLSGLGPIRRLVALGLRSVILVLFVLALADIQLERSNDRLTVIYLLDQSQSIPPQQRSLMIDYVNRAIKEHRDDDDQAGVIVFGADAAIEVPPFDDDVQMAQTIESLLDPNYTNLAGALKLAQASFPEDGARRVVIISDGNETLYKGEAIRLARDLVEKGIGIDVHPVKLPARGEVIVEKLAMPSDVRKGQPFDLTAVVTNTTEPSEGNPGTVSGRLIISQRAGDQPVVLSDERIELDPGKRVFTVRQQIEQPAFYEYEAQFVPDDPDDDATPQNNRATTFTHIRGSGQVLMIEDAENRGEHNFLAERLRKANLEVEIRTTDQIPSTLPELQPYDTVILANVPREHFSDQQIKMLVSNTQHMGCGLVMLGGPNSFGAGGWTNTELEAAMPIDFQIKSAKVVPKGALALIMHASELANGNYWQKVISREAIKALGNQDYCGLLHYDDWSGGAAWLWNHPRGMVTMQGNRDKMLALLDRMTPGDMPDFDPAMVLAQNAFARLTDAAIKHMIIVSDGDPTPPSNTVIQGLVTMKVTVSTVAVGTHGPANSATLQSIATRTGGKYYAVTNNKALPRIFQREARRVARPLIYEDQAGFQPRIRYPNEMVSGLEPQLPPITGYVMTTVKSNPLVEVALVSPKPGVEENATILASWTYGLGKAVAFTSDAGARWSTNWTEWENYDKLFSQMVRWSMRPVGDQGKFLVATDVKDGKGTITVTALDQDDAFLNFLDMSATIVGPDMEPIPVELKQTQAGRYSATFDAQNAGSYFVLLSPGGGRAPLRTGLNVPYSPEFQHRSTNEELLRRMAELAPKRAPAGKVIEDRVGFEDPQRKLEELLKVNSFRHDLPKARTSQEAWHYLVLIGSCLFFCDVFVRRVTVNLEWVPPLAERVRNRLFGRDAQPDKVEYMDRLRSRKAEVTGELEQKRAAARFEPAPDAAVDTSLIESEMAATPAQSKPPEPEKKGLAADQEEETYTSRLLKAKKKVWEERQ